MLRARQERWPSELRASNSGDDVCRSTLTPAERIDYTDSVKCLMGKPSRISSDLAPGALSRYDDFIATHINKTLQVHTNGVFLSWHRHFAWLFEQALREECGYQGFLPYWNWPLWADDLAGSPLFDASETSLSGDGEYDPDAVPPINFDVTMPRGKGGGCIMTGPFARTVLHFRTFKTSDLLLTKLPDDALKFAPHCFRRDLNNGIAMNNTNQDLVDSMLLAPNISAFQGILDGYVPSSYILAPHAGGHWSLGAELRDVFSSPSDPAFYLHHTMVDLVWTTWQAKDPATRQYALSGGSTSFNRPPSPDVTVDFVQDFIFLDEGRRIEELMDVTKGQYRYRYEYDEQESTKHTQTALVAQSKHRDGFGSFIWMVIDFFLRR